MSLETIHGPVKLTRVLGILGSALGLGWSNATLAIAAYCGRRYGADSALPNTVIGIGLAILSFICELATLVP